MRKEVRVALLKKGIPIAVTDTDRIDAYLPAGVVVVTEEHLMSDVKYMSAMHEHSPIILFEDMKNLVSFADEIYDKYCNDKHDEKGRFNLLYKDSAFYLGALRIAFTKTEARILRMLMCAKGWESAERISLYCFNKQAVNIPCVAVHICNINKKLRALTGFDVIQKKRYYGYRILSDD